jgi:hypothetical protein
MPSSGFAAFLLNLETGVDYVAAPITPLPADRALAEPMPMSTPLQPPTPLLSSDAPSVVAVVDGLTIVGYEGRPTMAEREISFLRGEQLA